MTKSSGLGRGSFASDVDVEVTADVASVLGLEDFRLVLQILGGVAQKLDIFLEPGARGMAAEFSGQFPQFVCLPVVEARHNF